MRLAVAAAILDSLVIASALVTPGALAPEHDLALLSDENTRQSGCTGGCADVIAETQRAEQDGFKSRPPRSLWEDRFSKVASAASHEPCNADIVATCFDRPVGFGSRINCFAAELAVAWYHGRSFSLCNSSKTSNFVRNIWSPHFENVAGFSVCASKKKQCGVEKKDALEHGDLLGQKLRDADREYLIDMKRFLYQKIFALSRSTRQEVDRRLASAGLIAGEPYVAVHVRHGDKSEESEPVKTGSYSEAARPLLDKKEEGAAAAARLLASSASLGDALRRELRSAGASVVYVCSDDAAAAGEIAAALGSHIRVVEQPRGEQGAYETREYQDEEGLLSVLVDLQAIVGAKSFVGTGSSNMGRLAYYLRPKGSVSVSLDEDWLLRQK